MIKMINGHPEKRALICYVLLKNGPQTRIAIMKAVHALEGKQRRFKPMSNQCYWLRDAYKNPWTRNETRMSVLVDRGNMPILVTQVGTVNRFHVYDLTEEGRALGSAVAERYGY